MRNFFKNYRKLKRGKKIKNIPIDKGCFGGTSFTSMATTMDYNVNIHRDINDYLWCFILSLGFESKN